MKIIRFEAENVKKLKAVEITPDGNMVVLGGRNGQGKSSVLDSIMVALGGTKYSQEKMVRDGKKKGFVELDLGDLTVRRTFTAAGGGVLTVKGKDGKQIKSPQAVLDALVGKVSFDPLAFCRARPREQAEVIKDLAGLDFSELDDSRQQYYEMRTGTNRDIKRLEADLEQLEYNDDPAYASEIDIHSLLNEIESGRQHNARLADQEEKADELIHDIAENADRINELKAQIERLEQHNSTMEAELKECQDFIGSTKSRDIEPLREKLQTAEEHNRVYRQNQRHLDVKRRLQESVKIADDYTSNILHIDLKKEEMVKAADMPIGGLAFDDDGLLTYNGIPFSQASQGEQIKVSVAIGVAANPKLKVLLVKEGSFLDDDNLKMIAKMAKLSDAQLWIETVGNRDGVSVVMEDGTCRAHE